MKNNVKKSSRIVLMLALVMMLTVVLAACIDTDKVPEVDAELAERDTEAIVGGTSEDEVPPPAEGQSNHPTVEEPVHISPMVVAVYGTCDEGAVIRIKCEDKVETVNSRNGYYIARIELPNENGNKLFVTAQVGDLAESNAVSVAAFKDATADKSSMSVAVGSDSRLYFEYMLDNYKGGNETLFTISQLKTIRDNINTKVTNYKTNAKDKDVEVIYLLLPDPTSVNTEVLPEDAEKGAYGTIYDQFLENFGGGNTRATVIDMREKLIALKDDPAVAEKGGLYRVTDSSLTDYGAYLVYSELMNYIDDKFPQAAARNVDEFEWNTIENALGGNYVTYCGLDKKIITETLVKATPKFSLDIGSDEDGFTKLSSIAKYLNAENKDFNFVTSAKETDADVLLTDLFAVSTDRKELPTAVICRDYNSLVFTDWLVERFEKATVLANNDFAVDTNATLKDYAAENEAAPDYIIYILSEQNIKTAAGK
jgi:hypothetical protein